MAEDTDTGAMPENADIALATSMLHDLGDDDTPPVNPDIAKAKADAAAAAENASAEGDDTEDTGAAEGDEADGEGEGEEDTKKEAAEGEEEATTDDLDAAAAADAPAFWSAEDKAAWAKVPADLRPVLAKYEQQRVAFVNQKAQEAAGKVKAVEEAAKQAHDIIGAHSAWWEVNREKFTKTFIDKWTGVDWSKLAEDNPAEWARLREQRDTEAGMLQQANEQARVAAETTSRRAQAEHQQARREEQAKLADRLPEFFGDDKAEATYKRLGAFLYERGLPVERINAIYEAPVVELALDAMRYRELQAEIAAARAKAKAKPAATTATTTTTPKRIEPGPVKATGNRTSDAVRQVRDRVHRRGEASIADASELIRLNGL